VLIVRPPHAWHTLLVNLGPQSASLVSCFLLLDRQARPVPVCAASRSWISWQLPLWGQDPKGRGSAAQSVTTAAYVPFAFIRGGLLGLGYLSAASCLGEQSSARFSSCGFYPTSQRKPTWCSWSPGMPCALRFKPPSSCRWLGCPWAALHRCPWGGVAWALWGGLRIQRFLQGAR